MGFACFCNGNSDQLFFHGKMAGKLYLPDIDLLVDIPIDWNCHITHCLEYDQHSIDSCSFSKSSEFVEKWLVLIWLYKRLYEAINITANSQLKTIKIKNVHWNYWWDWNALFFYLFIDFINHTQFIGSLKSHKVLNSKSYMDLIEILFK